jgi:hypothetical protein
MKGLRQCVDACRRGGGRVVIGPRGGRHTLPATVALVVGGPMVAFVVAAPLAMPITLLKWWQSYVEILKPFRN